MAPIPQQYNSFLELIQKDPMQVLPLFAAVFVMIGVRLWVRKALAQKKPKVPKSTTAKIVLTGITIYPVKSCKGITMQQAKVGPFGLENDRRWMLYGTNTKRFITQRQNPRMSLIVPSFKDSHLCLDYPNLPTLKIPLGAGAQRMEPIVENIGIWKSFANGVDEGDEVAAWFSKALEHSAEPVRLIRISEGHSRPVPSDWMQTDMKKEQQLVSYADGFAFLLTSNESLSVLNSKLPSDSEKLPMCRFRPNFVVEGLDEGFDEDTWTKIRIGETTFRVVKPCTRCKLTTVDPDKGEFAGEEPLRTLKTFRKGIIEHQKNEVCFGQNLLHETHGSQISVGQRVEVLA